jgi:hypothetical protein
MEPINHRMRTAEHKRPPALVGPLCSPPLLASLPAPLDQAGHVLRVPLRNGLPRCTLESLRASTATIRLLKAAVLRQPPLLLPPRNAIVRQRILLGSEGVSLWQRMQLHPLLVSSEALPKQGPLPLAHRAPLLWARG